jgi:predicted membrane-bound mannosyltransferase
MTLSRKLSIATAGAAAILSALSVPVSAFTITQPQGAAYDLSDSLTDLPPAASGTVTLNPAVVGYLAPPAAGATLFTRFGAEAAAQFPNWTAVSGAALDGILTIDQYTARDDGQRRGGADMIATYARAATDPAIANLRFIQLFIDNTGADGALVSHIDPFPNDDPLGNPLPWYWTEAEHTRNSTANTMTFRDSPADPVTTIPFNRTVRFETYLATFDNTTKVATIRDGWSWGYDVEANTQGVPEPLTILSSAAAIGFGAFFKREVSKNRKKS